MSGPGTAEAKPSAPGRMGAKGSKPMDFKALSAEEKAALEAQKSNSTSTMYVQSTISVPDVDRILLSVGLLLEQMIEEPPEGGWSVSHQKERLLASSRVRERRVAATEDSTAHSISATEHAAFFHPFAHSLLCSIKPAPR